MKASEILKQAIEVMEQKGKDRDVEQERSMARCVKAYNALTGRDLSERDGWLFMVVLKMARGATGEVLDDWLDGAAYCALAGETVPSEIEKKEHERLPLFKKPPHISAEMHKDLTKKETQGLQSGVLTNAEKAYVTQTIDSLNEAYKDTYGSWPKVTKI